MFFIKKADQYWTGKEWSKDYRQAPVYGSAAAAVHDFPRRQKGCMAVPLNAEQWAEI
jgi:hypothetical protein